MTNRFAGKTAFVADAASVLGRAIVARLADEGANVMAADGDGAAVRALADQFGQSVQACALTVTDPASWAAAIEATADAFGRLDVFVTISTNDYAAPKLIAETSLAEFRAVTAHNLDGALYGLQTGILKMRALGNGGAVVLVSSAACETGKAGHGALAASSHGITLMMKSAALACTDAKDGIRVNAVQGGDAASVAAAVAFLASNQASYVTGQVIAAGNTPVAA
ncbi:MAG: SDR family oxidoreductase [Rhodobacteraceae bacterium]|nr:SDR family oxidoreductase [Paracoccaceae bacterium]